MRYFKFIFSLTFLLHLSCSAQSIKYKIDSLKAQLIGTNDLIKRNDILYKITSLYSKNKPESAMKYARLALNNANEINNKSEITKGYCSIGAVYRVIS